MNSKNLSLVGIALAVALFLGVNLLAGPALKKARVDLTEQKLYTLSDGTRNIVSTLEEPITLRYFFSRKLASEEAEVLLSYADRVREMLEQYSDASNGNLELEIIEPEPFSEEEELAVSYGLQGIQTAAGDMIYFGLVGTNSVDDEEVIPRLDPQREASLEYDISEMIDSLENTEPAVVALVTGLPLRGGPAPPPSRPGMPPQPDMPAWEILQLVEQRYEVRDLDPATLEEIPDDVEILLVVQPKGLTEAGQYAIDQFAMRGGKILAFLDAFCLSDPALAGAQQNPAAMLNAGMDESMNALLSAWGLELEPMSVVGDGESAILIGPRGGEQVALPIYFGVDPETGMAEDDILTEALAEIELVAPGNLIKAETTPEGLEVEPLFWTSEDGGGTVSTTVMMTGFDPGPIADAFAPSGGSYSVGMRVRGSASSAFPDGSPTDEPEETLEVEDGASGEDEGGEGDVDGEESGETDDAPAEADDPDHLAASTAPFNAIIVSDADMLATNFWAQRIPSLFGGQTLRARNGNAPMLVGALENLSGSNDLISLRSRAEYARPFEKKEELLEQAGERFRAEEQELDAKLQDAQTRLNDLQAQRQPGDEFLLSPEQEEEIAKFREEEAATRSKLREVRRNLNADVEALGTRLKLLNIALIPLLIAAFVSAWFLTRRGTGRA